MGIDREKMITILTNRLNPSLIYLFGSYAKGISRQDSDVDLAILCQHEMDPYDLFMIGQELAIELNKEVDLIDLRSASTVMATNIIGNGQLIYCSNENQRQQFEMVTFKMYAKLNEERAEIIKQIKERGTVFGTEC